MSPISPICPIRPPTDKQRPRCSHCKAPLVVPEDIPGDPEGFIGEWEDGWRGGQKPYCFECWDNAEVPWSRGPIYVAAPYASWRDARLVEENQLLAEWRKGPGAPGHCVPMESVRGGGGRRG